jgi:glycerol kinase
MPSRGRIPATDNARMDQPDMADPQDHRRFVVAIDQGTTATKAHQLFRDGDFRPVASVEHRQFYPQPGWVEHDPAELLANVRQCVALAQGADAVALDNQGETVVAWNADSGEPICNAIVWQDNRTRAHLERLEAEGAGALTLERAGLPLDPYFSASKLGWILDHVPEAKALAKTGRLRLATSDAFFLDRLCGSYATDVTTASRTSLMNIATGQWDPELCRLFGVPIDLLPPIVPTVHAHGTIRGTGLPMVASVVDQQAALMGHGCQAPGDLKITFGTGAFALAISGDSPVRDAEAGILPTVAWRIGGRTTYAIDGGVYNAGSALDWAMRLGLFSDFRELQDIGGPTALERGLVFVPALSGLACPFWDRSAAGMWLGMGLETKATDLLQALLEGVALRTAQAVAALARHLPLRAQVSVDGGLTRNPYFCEFLARALDRTVVVPSTPDLTGLGCARFAFLGAGHGSLQTLPPMAPPDRTVQPGAPLSAESHARFADAVSRTRGWHAA